ncbi:tetratricopeptide repeat protein [Lentzea sp. NPDC058450]|uniref:tetratricopeptide repeat protein n=1 Tax=Lentzea sp. NPDC058450 TaxID=3346505 RepID=UPI00365B4CED
MDRGNAIEETFAGWLYRPYFDLGNWRASGNPHTKGLMLARDSMLDRDDHARLHTTILPSARHAIIRHTGLSRYLVDDPHDLDLDLRTPAWQMMCDQLVGFDGLGHAAQSRVLWLLHRLSMHSAIVAQVPEPRSYPEIMSANEAAVWFIRAQAGLSLYRDGKGPLSLTELEHVVKAAPAGCWARIEATYLLAQFYAKHQGGNASALNYYLSLHSDQIVWSSVQGHEFHKLMSRYYRLEAFVPQLLGDHKAMTASLDLAEHHCESLASRTESERAEWHLLRSSLYETRTKEKLLLGRLDEALDYAEALVRLTPADPHPRLELGEVQVAMGAYRAAVDSYRWAALLGPHVVPVAEFMIGQCAEAMGDGRAARIALMRSLAADPLAISSASRLANLHGTDDSDRTGLSDWVQGRLAELRVADDGTADRLHAYQRYDGALGQDVPASGN